MATLIFNRLNEKLLLNYGDCILDQLEHKIFTLAKVVDILLFFRDEARYVKEEDRRYAYVVSRLLDTCVYPSLKAYGLLEIHQIWFTINEKEQTQPLPNHRHISNVLGTKDTNGKHINT